jgi:hypothetical protein
MDLKSSITLFVSMLDFLPGLKTKLAAVAAFVVAIISAWGALAPEVGLGDYVVVIPPAINAAIMALLAVGSSNAQTRLNLTKANKR